MASSEGLWAHGIIVAGAHLQETHSETGRQRDTESGICSYYDNLLTLGL